MSCFDRLNTGEGVGIKDADVKEYFDELEKTFMLVREYNTTIMDKHQRTEHLSKILRRPIGPDVNIVPPFYCDLGFNIDVKEHVLINYNCTLLDTVKIEIGDHTMIGPGTQIVTAVHPFDHMERRDLVTSGKPIKIGDDVWIGAGSVILPGVTIGDRCIVGAGSVVTKNVPSDTVVVGNPAHILRQL